MKRGAPMKRTGFKRGQPVRTPSGLVGAGGAWERARLPLLECGRDMPLRRGKYSETGNVASSPQPKREYVRSEALLAAVRKLPCMHTGIYGRTEPAHSNWAVHGKGKGIKADDNRVAALAHEIHADLDQGSKMSEQERQDLWWLAHCKTVAWLLCHGDWPAGVPVPSIAHNPFEMTT